MQKTAHDHILGALIGAMVGDAAGVALEFHIGEITPKRAAKAMRMPGGGRFNVAPGQPSDDTELMLALAGALCENSSSNPTFNVDAIAAAYHAWYQSEPFDMGRTCARAFAKASNADSGLAKASNADSSLAKASNAAEMQEQAAQHNMQSQANGALMRVMPIPAFFYTAPTHEIALMARLDAQLSHPNPICQDVNALYSIAIAHLINNPGDHIGALKLIKQQPNIHPTVKEWIQLSKQPLSTFDCDDNPGHVKHAFVLALYFLRRYTPYEDAIRQIISLSYSDTDTNAAIVGGLIGALHGYAAIPNYMKDPVLAFDPSRINRTDLLGRPRPAAYRPAKMLEFVDKLFRDDRL